MEYTSRKQRLKNRHALEEIDEKTPAQRAEEEIFKEQKKRLRRQLNSASTFAIDSNDMKITPNALQTRTEVKKQKKIDEILQDIAVLPENEYLNEDTNLRLLKKMSVAKKYNRLQLSPAQEEKMVENKEKFETITNQLWFLIRELEKGKVPEPEIGTIPMVAAENVVRGRSFFDVETAKTATQEIRRTNGQHDDADMEMVNMNTKIDLLEEKLEKISLKNDELEEVLQDLEKVVQEGKNIVNDEVALQAYDIGEAPEDTLELLGYLEKLDELNKTKALEMEANRRKIEETTQLEALAKTQHAINVVDNVLSDEEIAVPVPKPKKKVEVILGPGEEKEAGMNNNTQPKAEHETKTEVVNNEELKETNEQSETTKDEVILEQNLVVEPEIASTTADQTDELGLTEEAVEPVTSTVTPKTQQLEQVTKTSYSTPIVDTEEITVERTTEMPVAGKVTEAKNPDRLQRSITILSVLFVALLIVLAVFIIYMWQQGMLSFNSIRGEVIQYDYYDRWTSIIR